MAKKLKAYQLQAVQSIIKNKNHAIFADPGLGKTVISLTAIKLLLESEEIEKVLIVAPLIICRMVWPQEIKKWYGYLKRYIQRLYKNNTINQNKKIFLINPESIHKIDLNQFDMLFIDESTTFKNPSSKRFKVIRPYLKKFKRKIILTGTPTPNSVMDLYSQIYILDEGKSLGKKITGFRDRYCKANIKYIGNSRKFFTYTVKKGSDKAIAKRISHLVTRLDAKDHFKSNDPIFNDIWVRMNKKEQATYNNMEKNLFAELKGKEILAFHAGSAYNKCRQLANGAIYTEDKSSFVELHTLKIDILESLINELQGKPILLGYAFKHDIQRIMERIDGVTLINSKSSLRVERNWNKGKYPILAGQVGAISHGLNLQHGGCNIIFFGLTDNPDSYEQFIKRILRTGFKGILQIHRILCKKTVDVPITKRLKVKGDNQITMLKLLHNYMISRIKN